MDQPRDPRAAAPNGWNRGRPRRRAAPAVAAALAVVALALLGAILLLPGLAPGASPSPAASTSSGPTGSCTDPCLSNAPVESPPAVTPSPLPSFIRPTPTPLPTFATYVVRPGDSLSSIARTFATTPRSLAWWNRGTYPNLDPQSAAYDPNHVEPGWVLSLIPGVIVDDLHPPTPSPGLATPSASPGPAATTAVTPGA